MPTVSTDPHRRQTFVTGVVLLFVTLLAVAAMAHHPTVARAPDLQHAIQGLALLGRTSALVHAALIGLMLVTLHCLTEFAWRRGLARPLVRGGLIAYATGVLVMIGAALVSGFVVTDVASTVAHETTGDLQIARQLLQLCGSVNQACARFGAVAMSAGIALWSLDLLRERGIARGVGLLGIVVGLVPIVALLAGAIRLDVHGMLQVVLLQAAWNLGIAALLMRERPGRAPDGMERTAQSVR